MTEDRYPVESDATMGGPHGAVSYFVIYDGPAEDDAAFRAYYHANHPPILGRLPGVRSTVLGTPADWRDPLGIEPAGHMHLCDISFEFEGRAQRGAGVVGPHGAARGFRPLPALRGRGRPPGDGPPAALIGGGP